VLLLQSTPVAQAQRPVNVAHTTGRGGPQLELAALLVLFHLDRLVVAEQAVIVEEATSTALVDSLVVGEGAVAEAVRCYQVEVVIDALDA